MVSRVQNIGVILVQSRSIPRMQSKLISIVISTRKKERLTLNVAPVSTFLDPKSTEKNTSRPTITTKEGIRVTWLLVDVRDTDNRFAALIHFAGLKAAGESHDGEIFFKTIALHKVYLAWKIEGLLKTLASSIYWLFSAPEEKKKISLLLTAGLLEGSSMVMGPLIQPTVDFYPCILVSAFVETVVALGCFSVAAMLAKCRKYLYLVGALSSGLFILFWLNSASLIFGGYEVMFKFELVDLEAWKEIMSRSEKNSVAITTEGAVYAIPRSFEGCHLHVKGSVDAVGVLQLELICGRLPYCLDTWLVDFEAWKEIMSRSEKNSIAISTEGAVYAIPCSFEGCHLDVKGNVDAVRVLQLELICGRPPYWLDTWLVDFEARKEIMSRSEKNSVAISTEGAVYAVPCSFEGCHLDVKGNVDAVGVLQLELICGRPPYCLDIWLFLEEIVGDIHKADSDWKIILHRFFNPVGAHDYGKLCEDPKGVPNNLFPCTQLAAGGRLQELYVHGHDYPTSDCTAIRAYIHVMVLADGHVAALKKLFRGFIAHDPETGCGRFVLETVAAAYEKAGKELEWNEKYGKTGMYMDQ